MTVEEQRMSALATANAIRTAGARVLRMIRAGELSAIDALDLPDAQWLQMRRLLTGIRWVGPKRAARIMRQAGVTPDLRVRDMTERQRGALAAAIRGWAGE